MSENETMILEQNNSGSGTATVVPRTVEKRFNWGAFLFGWIWCLRYKKYWHAIGMIILMFIPVLNILGVLGFAIWFGIKGNEWAWQAREYSSEQEFHRLQKAWVKWWFGLLCISFIINIFRTVPTLERRQSEVYNKVAAKKSVSYIDNAAAIASLQYKLPQTFTNETLAELFSKEMKGTLKGNSIETKDGTVHTFFASGDCSQKTCYVLSDTNGAKGPNKLWQENDTKPSDQIKIYIIKKDNTLTTDIPKFIFK